VPDFLRRSELLELVARCELLADDLDANRVAPEALLAEVSRLRACFDVLHQLEEREPRLPPPHRAVRREPRAHVASTITDELRATLDRLREHLFAET
jgi:hypothetical protein